MKGLSTAKRLNKLERQVLNHIYLISPRFAVRLGLHQYDGKLPDLSKNSIGSWVKRARELVEELDSVEESKLGLRRRLDKELLKMMLEQRMFEFGDLRMHEKLPMIYAGNADMTIYTLRPYASWERRLKALTRQFQGIPNLLNQADHNLSDKIPSPYVEYSIMAVRGMVKQIESESPKLANRLHGKVRKAFLKASEDAVSSLKHFLNKLENHYKPNSIPEFAIGRENYEKMLWVQDRLKVSLEDLLEMGMKNLEKDKKEFIEVASKISPSKAPKEVVNQISQEHPTAEDLIKDVQSMIDEIKEFISNQKLVAIPKGARCKVVETPPAARAFATAAMNSPGPFEKRAREGYYYVTPVEEEWSEEEKEEWLRHLNYASLKNISIHEVYPGHYLHWLYKAKVRTNVGRIFSSYAFTEGWAHYCEEMVLQQGYGDEKLKIAQLQDALLRDCRFICSIKMHTMGMSLEEATDFFVENAFLDRFPAYREAFRGTFDPGYLSYTLGKLMILRAKEKYFEKNPEKKLIDFHKKLLTYGSPPIGLLENIVLDGI